MSNAPPKGSGWPARLREAHGMRVTLKREISNGMSVAPAGLAGIVETAGNGWHLLQFRGDPCACCGVSVRVSRMSWRDMEPAA